MTDIDDARLWSRVRELLADAVARLDPQDRDERIAYCREHNQHGVRMHTDPDGVLEFRWGGRRLALVRAADLAADVPLRAELVGEVPDVLPQEWQ